MTFLSFNQKELYKVLGICNQLSSSKNPIETFTYTKVQTNGEFVSFSAVNQDAFFKTKIKPISLEEAQDELSFLIKTDVFHNAVGLISDEIIGLDLNLEKNTIKIQGSKTKHTLRINTDSLDEFNEPTQKTDELSAQITVDSSELLKANKLSSVSVGNPKTVYQSEFLSICYTLNPQSNKLILASTDRYRVSRIVIDARYEQVSESLKDEKKNFLIPPKGLNLLNNFNQKETTLAFEDTFLWIKADETTLVLRYGEGQFPDYERIIPQSFSCTFSVNSKELLESLKQAQFSARINSNSQSVTLKIKPQTKSIVLTSKTDDGYSSESSVDIIDYEGVEEDWEQSFNIDYLIGYVSIAESDYIFWESNPGKPSVLSPQNQKDRQLYLVSGLK